MAGAAHRRDDASERDLIATYLDEIGRVPLLTKDDEARLAQAIEEGRAAQAALDAGARGSQATRLRRTVRDGERARDDFVEANLRLVVSVARRYQHHGLSLLDLVQEGNLGLIRAVEKFDWRKGFKFSTYATWWIRQAIQRGIANTGRTIRLPAHAFDEVLAVKRTATRLEGELGRWPSNEEIAADCGMTPNRVEELLLYSADTVSLDQPLREDADDGLGDLVADPTALDPAEESVRASLPGEVERMVQVLNDREKAILTMRHGLHGGEPATLDEVGANLRLTRERIRQIEARALSKLRHPSCVGAGRELLAG
ncbi:MAG: RNA polymerase sigma factor RpoD/SigA [Actinomycetes bacterium]